MLVYGDIEVERDAGQMHASIVSRLGRLHLVTAGLSRHIELVACFIELSEVITRLLDRVETAEADAMAALTALAGCVDRSWRSEFQETRCTHEDLRRIRTLVLTGVIRTKMLEGYAFYGLYPESYAEAARRSGLGVRTRVIGIRSIGTSLAAIVAAALGAAPPVTVRPVGHPFDRRLELGPLVAEQLLADDCDYAIVDEGPGLSGSSFGAVIDWLTARGVPMERIHLFPSHLHGPGPQAGPARQAQWQACRQHVVPIDDLIGADRLSRWLAPLVGALTAPLADISGGAWREVARVDVPVASAWERRKFLAQTASGTWLVKFAGLGEIGAQKLALAQRLHAGGFGLETVGLRHGFLVQRWVEGPNLVTAPLPSDDLLPQLAAYLAFRAGLAAPAEAGASLDRLTEMAVYNTAEALGDEAAKLLSRRLTACQPADVRRVYVDARLHRWEWLTVGGRCLKTDAVDHAMAHDFIGAQDIAWDVAGAVVEHELAGAQADELIGGLNARLAASFDPAALGFYVPCYLAFQLGAWTMATGHSVTTLRYRDQLSALLGS